MEINQERSNLELTSLSEDIFDQLLGDAPSDSTVNHNSIVGGNKPEEKKEEVKVEEKKSEENTEENTENKTEVNSEEAIDLEDTEEENNETLEIDASEFLKSQYQGLVDRGQWFALEDEDLKDFKWDEENFGKLIELQANWNAEDKYNEKVEATGKYGKAIIDYISNGGNPEDIITLFKEVKEIENFDTSTKEGKEGLLRKYYVEELGWKESVFKKYVESLIDKGEIDTEVEEANKELQDRVKDKVEEAKKQQEAQLKIQKEREANFASNMNNIISTRKDISAKEKQEVLNSLLVYDQKLPDGRLVNQFSIDFMKLQSDPSKYVDLVLFVRNPEKYIQKIETEVESKANKKAWNLIKNGSSLNRNSGTKNTEKKQTNKNDLVIDYKSILNNR